MVPVSYRIYCDETWKNRDKEIVSPYYVFHGVLLAESVFGEIVDEIEGFRNQRGIVEELKWTKISREFKNAQRRDKRSRYEEYLERIFFRFMVEKKISFGVMYLEKTEYDRVERDFTEARSCSKHEFFFMLYFQFLTHCFIKNQVKNQPVKIYIDGRNLGKVGMEYDLSRLTKTLNFKSEALQRWRSQPTFEPDWMTRIRGAIQDVELLDSDGDHLIQLADVVAGCFRYILENKIPPPSSHDQGSLFETNTPRQLITPQDHLSDYFYSEIRKIKNYEKFDMCAEQYHYRFNIFPFRFV